MQFVRNTIVSIRIPNCRNVVNRNPTDIKRHISNLKSNFKTSHRASCMYISYGGRIRSIYIYIYVYTCGRAALYIYIPVARAQHIYIYIYPPYSPSVTNIHVLLDVMSYSWIWNSRCVFWDWLNCGWQHFHNSKFVLKQLRFEQIACYIVTEGE